MISMQTQVSRGQGTKLSGSWKQLHWFLSLTMLGWLSYQKPPDMHHKKKHSAQVCVFKIVLKCC